MAEIWRQRGELDRAEEYARKALNYGARKANLTLANIEYARGRNFSDKKQVGKAKAKYALALDILKGFTPEFGHDEEVRDAIASKIYREREDWEDAKNIIGKYVDPINPYTIYEQCVISIHDASTLLDNMQKTKWAPTVHGIDSAASA
jgi:tetratricopeptide (TPR) repeat protein